jgi:hypothetical protein
VICVIKNVESIYSPLPLPQIVEGKVFVMDVLEAIRTRRSIRKFRPKPMHACTKPSSDAKFVPIGGMTILLFSFMVPILIDSNSLSIVAPPVNVVVKLISPFELCKSHTC